MHHTFIDSPLGRVLLVGNGPGLMRISFQAGDRAMAPPPGSCESRHALRDAARQVEQYFAGTRRSFELELDPVGTAFQRKVWQQLAAIPYGETITYVELARRIGQPTASRAVGNANGRNPLPIVIPCHRVVGSDGSLTGYAGGTHLKQFLLNLELH